MRRERAGASAVLSIRMTSETSLFRCHPARWEPSSVGVPLPFPQPRAGRRPRNLVPSCQAPDNHLPPMIRKPEVTFPQKLYFSQISSAKHRRPFLKSRVKFLTTDVYKNYTFKKHNQFLYFKNISTQIN